MKNYSKQREAILKVLKADRSHPTAASVYKRVREELPNISLGTVYRNLAELERAGEIISLSVGDGTEHFDGDTSSHIHLVCSQCGEIVDIPDTQNKIFSVIKDCDFDFKTSVCTVFGICKKCRLK